MCSVAAVKTINSLVDVLVGMAAKHGIAIAVITQHADANGQEATAVKARVSYDKTCESSKMNAAVVSEVVSLLDSTMELDGFRKAVAMRYAKMEGSAGRKPQSFEELLDMIFKA
jgi:hypothetical protein